MPEAATRDTAAAPGADGAPHRSRQGAAPANGAAAARDAHADASRRGLRTGDRLRGALPGLRRGAIGVALGLAVASAALLMVAATSGVLDRRPGAWTVPLRVLPRLTVEANVPGLLRLATSPLGRAALAGRSLRSRYGLLRIARDGDALLLRCARCRIDDRRLAAGPVALPPLELRVARRAGIESNNLLDLRLRATTAAGAVELQAVATLAPTGVTLAWTLPATPLAALYALAADAVPEARIARIDGSAQGSGRLRLPAWQADNDVRIDGFAVGGLTTEKLQHGWFAHVCRAADGSTRPRLSGEGERDWLDADALGTLLPAAVLAAEDQRFLRHPGYDVVEIAQALDAIDADGGPALRGASTLTQQLARTLFTGGERSLARKLRELLYAVEMERTLGKPRILQLYLNTVDWGPGLCGARAAARRYFGRRVAQLTPLEAAWLASALRAPHAAHAQQFLRGQPDADRARRVLMQMRELPRAQRERAARQTLAFAPPGRRAAAAGERNGAAPVPPAAAAGVAAND